MKLEEKNDSDLHDMDFSFDPCNHGACAQQKGDSVYEIKMRFWV